ncbi:membrane protein DedA, SNARE-associated domain [Sanguibacter gelidistatuariae]|uniref:Membrane protein DedA, SNARE-associated domain n=1 Tax=Sanguibacter gelidistatuariae TaxID=1814289 RepID=A0A1G6S0A3_9MICO|nr:VTT domain-containing protein [Sanguibacter gelidistatuariae]SDD10258.1 membrane protein DedA, SNARE-associated domain [Sanguibacter gelidistatuariae]
MPDLDGAPFVAIFCFFFAIVIVRTQATYWLARLVAAQTVGRSAPKNRVLARAQAWSQSPSAARGNTALNRWGVLAVPLSFFTVGFKSVVNAAAGLTQMPFRRYLPAMLLGCMIHATIYATVGWAAWEVALAAAAGSPWGIAVLAALLLATAALITLARRRSARTRARVTAASGGTDGPQA